jgi:lipid biosynthesis B12-binding/radical SAM protein
MKRILLVSANTCREPLPVYPLGLSVIAAALAAAGHRVEQFDFLAAGESEEALLGKVAEFDPDFVGLSLRNIDNCDSMDPHGYTGIAKRLVDAVRRASPAPVILGGAGFSLMPEEMLAFIGADYGIVGEGERLVRDLIRDLSNGERPASPLLRNERPLSGGEIPSPLYQGELTGYYMERSGMCNLQTKRGCPYRCTYCTYPALEGNRFRFREPGAVADDIERAGTDLGVDRFFVTDSIFNDREGHYLSFAEEILRRGLTVRWCCYIRPEGIGRKEIALLKRAGMSAAELGTDAASNVTLASLGKGFGFEQVLEVNRSFNAERVPCAHFVMFGGPGETAETVSEGLANIEKLENTVVFACSGIRILPGTALHARAVAEGLLSADSPLLEPVYYRSTGIDPEEMERRIAAAFHGARGRYFPPSEGLERLQVMYNFGYRGLLWDQLIRYPKEPAC